jgi:pyrimidine operon attenuation protein/uracil phosphoribosyltransferase
MPQIMSGDDVARAIRRIAHEIIERHRGASAVGLIGIRTRGVHLARDLASSIEEFEGLSVPLGELDVRGHRDDVDRQFTPSDVATSIPFDLDGRPVVVVDDVLYTGRTVRAALDAISEIGRADRIELAVLIDRGHRELPVRADYVGKNVPTASRERIAVHVPAVDGDSGVWIEKGAD